MATVQLDTFTAAYVACALWSSTGPDDSPLDDDYDDSDIAKETLEQMAKDCEAFQLNNADDLNACDLSTERAGHDFWLTRNHHGSGFWDEGYRRSNEANAALKRLTEASHSYGSFDLIVGDNGVIYGS